MRLVILWIALLALLFGCGKRSAQTLPPPPDVSPSAGVELQPDYIDLKPGWRVRVITPLLKSGGYRLQLPVGEISGSTVTLSAGEDFIGYETAFYWVHPRKRGGVRLEFASAEVTKEGEKTLQSHPQVQLFRLPRKAKFVRLFYLKRLSQADHNMAVVASNRMDVLETCTSDIQRNPADACDGKRDCFCSWVPSGIAVRPEVPTAGDGAESWGPAPVQK